jgi:hypothetical protein
MELAALAGQMETVAELVSSGGMVALAGFLARMGDRMRKLVLSDLSGSSATQALAADVRDVEEDVEAAGAVEMAEGLSELAAGGALEEAGRELAESGETMLAGSQGNPTTGSPRRRRRAATPPVAAPAPAPGRRRTSESNTERSGPRSRRRPSR